MTSTDYGSRKSDVSPPAISDGPDSVVVSLALCYHSGQGSLVPELLDRVTQELTST